MAGSSPQQQDVFDIRKVRRLVELMKEHDLSEVDLRQGDMRIQLRSSSEPVIAPGAVVPAAAVPAPVPAAAPAPAPEPAAAAPARRRPRASVSR